MGTALQNKTSIRFGLFSALVGLLILGSTAKADAQTHKGKTQPLAESASMDSIGPESLIDAEDDRKALQAEYDAIGLKITKAKAALKLNSTSKKAQQAVAELEDSQIDVLRGLEDAEQQIKDFKYLEAKKKGAAVAQGSKPKGVTTTKSEKRPSLELDPSIYAEARREMNRPSKASR